MRGTGEAVVADHAVGDEVARAGGDVVERHGPPERLDRDDAELRVALQRSALDRRTCAVIAGSMSVEEAQPLLEPATDPDGTSGRSRVGLARRRSRTRSAEGRTSVRSISSQSVLAMRRTPRAAAALRIEDAGQESLAASRRLGASRPRDQPRETAATRSRAWVRIARIGAMRARCRGERELIRRDVDMRKVTRGRDGAPRSLRARAGSGGRHRVGGRVARRSTSRRGRRPGSARIGSRVR